MINDPEMMSAFWGLVEQLLNTLLFALGGLVFGGIISNHGEREGYWTAKEWGYLLLLWVLLLVQRPRKRKEWCQVMFYMTYCRNQLSSRWG